MVPNVIPIMIIGGVAFGLGIGVIIGYFLGRRSRWNVPGFPVDLPRAESASEPDRYDRRVL